MTPDEILNEMGTWQDTQWQAFLDAHDQKDEHREILRKLFEKLCNAKPAVPTMNELSLMEAQARKHPAEFPKSLPGEISSKIADSKPFHLMWSRVLFLLAKELKRGRRKRGPIKLKRMAETLRLKEVEGMNFKTIQEMSLEATEPSFRYPSSNAAKMDYARAKMIRDAYENECQRIRNDAKATLMPFVEFLEHCGISEIRMYFPPNPFKS